MEELKNTERTQFAHNEPGRRYSSGRIRPRPGADVVPGSRPKASAVPIGVKTLQEVPVNKQIDAVKPVIKGPKKQRPAFAAKPALPRTARSLVLKRQIVERAKQERKKVRRTHRRHFVRYIVAGVVIVASAIIMWSFQELLPFDLKFFSGSPESNGSQVTDDLKPTEASSLDETAITKAEIISYMMADDAPRVLRIPKLDVEARVLRVGASLKSEPIAPTNIFDVGWFESSGKPGAAGAVLLNGHTAGPTKDGIFGSLRKLVPGDQIILEKGDGTLLTYRVSKVQEYSTNQIDMSAALEPIDTTKQGLNLMTTATSYNGQSDQSQKRIIVFAVL